MGGISRREWLGLVSAAAFAGGAKAAPSPQFLDVVLSYRQLNYVMTWGMMDHYSWLQGRLPRADGRLKRGSPYDDNYQPKRLRTAIADAFGAAPMRG